MNKPKRRRPKVKKYNGKASDLEMAAQLFAELFWRQVKDGDHNLKKP